MKVLGIYGSPRKGGNSDLLLDKVLEGAQGAGAQVEPIYARKLKISGCVECGGCDETGVCVINDGMADIYPKLEEARAIVLSAPMFFYNVPAQVKSLIDRTQAMWSGRMLKKKGPELKVFDSGTGYLIGVGATKGKNLFDGAELVAKYFYDAMDMDYAGGLFYRRVEKKGAIAELENALAEALEFGEKIVKTAA